jgi:hypothetical protein
LNIDNVVKIMSVDFPESVEFLKDVKSQHAPALTNPVYFKKWGAHYLRSTLATHKSSRCNNFKDSGVQVYGGKMMQSIRDKIDDIFMTLPPPVREVNNYLQGYRRNVLSNPSPNLRAYNNRGGGCFHPETLLAIPGGTIKACDIRCGQVVFTMGGKKATVKTTVIFTGGEYEMFNVEGFKLTSTHPVISKGTWCHPHKVGTPMLELQRIVYNFVLDMHHTVISSSGGVACTLAHGMTGPIIEHCFFGTEKIVKALSRFPGYDQGLVVVDNVGLVQDTTTGVFIDFDTKSLL